MGPRSLTSRILVSFALLSIVAWLAVGATMFVVLRGLHADATTSSLADISQTFLARFRTAAALRDVRATVTDIRDSISSEDITLHVIAADGQLVDVGAAGPEPLASIALPAGLLRGESVQGSMSYTDGLTHLYAATAVRGPNATGPRAILLSTVDRSAAGAARDVLRTLPVVVAITLLIGVPLALLLSRSVVRPLRRLAAATADLPAAGSAPLPLDGPTEVRELTDRFNAMSVELRQTRVRESELLANLRHDLRTPLTVISGYATALTDGTATGDDAARAASAIAEEAGRLEGLLAELGAIERLRAGTDGLHPEPIDSGEILAAAIERFRPGAAAAGIGIVLEPPEAAWPTFAADRVAVDRIVANLIANALAASPSPGGHIWLSARTVASSPTASGADAVAISVTDDGPGFAPGGAARAFERFYRGDRARAGQGSGLGLAIVQELARAHGGAATAENLAPRGARVSVVLPVLPRVS